MARIYRHPELERRIQERMYIRIAKAHEPRIKRAMIAQYNAAAATVAAGRKPGKPDGGKVKEAIESIMRDAFIQVGRRVGTDIDRSKAKSVKRAVQMDPGFEAGMGKYIRKNAARKVVEIDDTTKARIARLIQQGIDNGLTNVEVAASIREAGLIDSAYRSAVISRTESHAAGNAGSLQSAIDSEVVKEKEWISTEDERTRDGSDSDFDHTNVANVPVDEPFIVSGEELMYPGDPSGSAGNIINCRCAIGYVV
jgi:hypothetical protein